MQILAKMSVFRISRSLSYDYSSRLVSRNTCFMLIFLICAAYCIEARTFNFSNDSSSAIFRQSIEAQSLNSEQLLLPNTSWKTWNNSSEHRTENMEDVEFLDDYDQQAADFNLSYIGPDVVIDLGPDEMILSHDQTAPTGRRKPVVKDGFVWDQKMELLRLHNMYRSNVTPPAADINFMEWDEYLAKAAQDWANGCRFMHAFPPYVEPGSMGQNLYMGHDPTGVRAMLLWNEEYHDYDLKTLYCEPGKQCGHYTQLVWGDSKLVGCGMKRCAIKRFFVVCHYSPPGNIVGYAPYNVGKPCSQCRTPDGGLCTRNMCVTKEQCEKSPDKCEYDCTLKCRNCGTLDKETCRCDCSDGWDSLDCSRPCKNAHDRCGKNPGWPSVTSCPMNHHAVADTYCRKMCGKCRGVERSDPDQLCCNGTVCPEGHVLVPNQNDCKCDVLCPGPLCYITPDYEAMETTAADGGLCHHSKTIYRALIVLIIVPILSSAYGL